MASYLDYINQAQSYTRNAQANDPAWQQWQANADMYSHDMGPAPAFTGRNYGEEWMNSLSPQQQQEYMALSAQENAKNARSFKGRLGSIMKGIPIAVATAGLGGALGLFPGAAPTGAESAIGGSGSITGGGIGGTGSGLGVSGLNAGSGTALGSATGGLSSFGAIGEGLGASLGGLGGAGGALGAEGLGSTLGGSGSLLGGGIGGTGSGLGVSGLNMGSGFGLGDAAGGIANYGGIGEGIGSSIGLGGNTIGAGQLAGYGLSGVSGLSALKGLKTSSGGSLTDWIDGITKNLTPDGVGQGFDFAKTLSGLAGLFAASRNLNNLDNASASIGNLFAPGSAYEEQLRKELQRRDAASGRRSQYGPRSVELQAKLAELAARQTPSLMNLFSQQDTAQNEQMQSLLNVLNGTGLLNLFKRKP